MALYSWQCNWHRDFCLKGATKGQLRFLVIFSSQKFADLEVAIFRKCFYSLQVITANKSFHILNETLDSHVECYSSTLVGSSLFMIPSYVKSNDSILGCSNVNDFPINDTVTVSLEQLEASIFVVATFSLWELGCAVYMHVGVIHLLHWMVAADLKSQADCKHWCLLCFFIGKTCATQVCLPECVQVTFYCACITFFI
jgi:hypothetical protein